MATWLQPVVQCLAGFAGMPTPSASAPAGAASAPPLARAKSRLAHGLKTGERLKTLAMAFYEDASVASKQAVDEFDPASHGRSRQEREAYQELNSQIQSACKKLVSLGKLSKEESAANGELLLLYVIIQQQALELSQKSTRLASLEEWVGEAGGDLQLIEDAAARLRRLTRPAVSFGGVGRGSTISPSTATRRGGLAGSRPSAVDVATRQPPPAASEPVPSVAVAAAVRSSGEASGSGGGGGGGGGGVGMPEIKEHTEAGASGMAALGLHAMHGNGGTGGVGGSSMELVKESFVLPSPLPRPARLSYRARMLGTPAIRATSPPSAAPAATRVASRDASPKASS